MTHVKKSKVLWETTDYKGRYVQLTTERRDHIVAGHVEMVPYIGFIRDVIENPDMVVRSELYVDTEIASKYNVSDGFAGNQWLSVPVLYGVGDTGDVRTAFFSVKPKPGEPVYIRIKK